MSNFIFIFTTIILPIFLQIMLGFVLQKKLTLNISTLTKIQFYALIPAMLFVKIYSAGIEAKLFLMLLAFGFLFLCIQYILSWGITLLMKYPRSLSKAFINSVCFYNSGNFCLPLIQLLYNDPFAMSVQIIILMAQNISTNTLGIFNSSSGKGSSREALMNVIKMPMLYTIATALILKTAHVPVWTPVWSALKILSDGMIPIAIITLGAQLANTSFNFRLPRVYLSNFFRLIVGPFIAYLLTLAFGVHGVVAQVMILSSSAPTAVNTVLLAVQYDNEPDFASQTVFSATVLSSITVTFIIYLVTKFV